jgi:hypothetical protein
VPFQLPTGLLAWSILQLNRRRAESLFFFSACRFHQIGSIWAPHPQAPQQTNWYKIKQVFFRFACEVSGVNYPDKITDL